MEKTKDNRRTASLKERLDLIIFEADTPAGKAFDVVLLWTILFSVVAVMLESVPSLRKDFGTELRITEWAFTILFTAEYLVRIWVSSPRKRYIFSFFGLVDLVSILPTYLSLVFVGAQTLLIIRTLRLLRIFRILKLVRHMGAANHLLVAMHQSRAKITVFLGAVLSLAVIMGTIMYLVESPESGFTSIPRSVYWAIVTLTTVGYGDIAPQTILGQMIAAMIMIMGYSIIAVPTGIVSAHVARTSMEKPSLSCPECGEKNHAQDAFFCRKCGGKLE